MSVATHHPWRLAVAVTVVLHALLLAVPLRFELARPSVHEIVSLRFERPKPEPATKVPPEPVPPSVEPSPPEPRPPKRHKTKAQEAAPTEVSEPSPPVSVAVPVVDAVATSTATNAPTAIAAPDVVVVRAPHPTPIVKADAPVRRRAGTGDVNVYARGLRSAFLQHRQYPPAAIRLGLEGVAKVKLAIDRMGRLIGTPTVVQSSGHAVLDDEALRVVRAAAPFAPLPEDIEKDMMVFVLPIDFFLRDADQ